MKHTIIGAVLLMVLSGCGSDGPDIDWGKAECAHCRMNVMDRRFGAALMTSKGRQYVFDSPECMIQFVSSGMLGAAQVAGYYVVDHAHPGVLLDATKALFVHADDLNSPMRGNVVAFANAADRDACAKQHHGEPLDWSAVQKLLSN